MLIKSKTPVGIVSYGSYIPKFYITGKSIASAHRKSKDKIYKSLGVEQKTVPSIDEDTTTMSLESAFQALERTGLSGKYLENYKQKISSLFIGSESHPYAVKPTGTMVKQALGLSDNLSLADLQFACKAGTQALQICFSYVLSGMSEVGLAIGSDTAQSRPGDVLEYTAGAGSASYLVGTKNILAKLIATVSVATDTPDFWRRPGMEYPEHAGRFSGQPAYFKHVAMDAAKVMRHSNLKPKDFTYCVFHSPNAKFPQAVAKKLGFTPEQVKPSLVVAKIGNTYAASTMIGLSAVLDVAKKGDKILVVSYGSGAGSDAFVFRATKLLEKRRENWDNFLSQRIEGLTEIGHQEYLDFTSEGH